MEKNKEYYIKNPELLNLLKDYKETESEKTLKQICLVFNMIAEKILQKSNFLGYSKDRKAEMFSDGVYACFLGFRNFDPEISKNAFAYFSQICFNAARAYINDRKLYESRNISVNFIDNLEDGSGIDE